MPFFIKRIPGFEKAYISKEASMLGVRESWRIRGKYRLDAEDYFEARHFSDAICRTAYPIDIHDVKLNVSKKIARDAYYEIPYRALVTNEIENLIVAGRCISGSFAAQASFRIQPTCMSMGEAAGIAAACVEHNVGRFAVEFPERKNAFLAILGKKAGLAAEDSRHLQVRNAAPHRSAGGNIGQKMPQGYHICGIGRLRPYVRNIQVLVREGDYCVLVYLFPAAGEEVEEVSLHLLEGIYVSLPEGAGGKVIGHIKDVRHFEGVSVSIEHLGVALHLDVGAIDVGAGGELPSQQHPEGRDVKPAAKDLSGRAD